MASASVLASIGLALFNCLGGWPSDRGNDSQPPATQTVSGAAKTNPRQAAKLALLVGINKYKAVRPLSGCVADVHNMKALLQGKFDFPDDSIQILTDEQATRAAIIHAFKEHLIGRAADNAVVVFHYSGHGSRVKDRTGTSPSGEISTIVPHDSRTEGVFDISAVELRGYFSLLAEKTKNVTFLSDSCHSGMLLKDVATARARVVAPDRRDAPPLPPEARLATRGAGRINEGFKGSYYALLSACRNDEVAYEYADQNGNPCGTLTHFFVALVLGSGKSGVTYRDVMDKVKAKVNGAFTRQHPQLEGANMDNYVLSDRSTLPQPFVPASAKGDGIILEAGQVQGMTEGSVFDIYPPGTKLFDNPAGAIAHAELVTVGLYRSEARRIRGNPIEPSSRAVERQHHFHDRKVRLHIAGGIGASVLGEIRNAMLGHRQTDPANRRSPSFSQTFDLTADAANAELVLAETKTRDGARSITLRSGDGTELSPPAPLDQPGAVSLILERLTGWARWLRLFALDNPRGTLEVEFEIDSKASEPARGKPGNSADLTVVAGEKVEYVVTNKSGKDVHFAILDLASDGSVDVLYPAEGRNEALAPGNRYLGSAQTALPEGKAAIRDYIKLVATQSPVDFRFLRQEAIKEVPRDVEDPLSDLLGQAALIERGLQRAPRRLDGWTTKIKTLEVVAKP
jgi:hypothetical protein